MRKWLLKNFGLNERFVHVTLDQVVLSGTSFVLNLLLIRYLSVESFGIYVIAFSFLMLAGSIHSALVTSPIGVIVSRLDDREAVQYVSQLNFGVVLLCVIFTMLFSIVSIVLGVVGGYEEYQNPLYCVSFIVCFYLGQHYVRSILLSRLRLFDVLINDVLYASLQLVFVVSLIAVDELNVASAITSIGMAALVALIYGIYQCREFIKPLRLSISSGVKSNVEHGRWLLGTTLVAWGRTNMLNFIALYFMGPTAPAVLRAIQTVYGPVNMILVGLESVVPQFCSRVYAEYGVARLFVILRRVNVVLLFGMAVYMGLASFFAGEILFTLFGEKYNDYELIVLIIGVQYLFVVWQTMNMVSLRVINHPKYIFLAFVVESVVTMIPGVWLIKVYELEGMVAWKLLSAVFVAVMTYCLFRWISRAKLIAFSDAGKGVA
jgi:O-antigen/teichoic acid export membrane protein